MQIKMKMGTTLALYPKLIESLEVLHLGPSELSDYLQELAETNPVIEYSLPTVMPHPIRVTGSSTQTILENTVLERQMTLQESLEMQIGVQNISSEIAACAKFIIGLLDKSGYLEEATDEICVLTGESTEVVDAALATVRWLDPPGVGAHSISDCLKLQLERLPGDNELVKIIVSDYLEEVGAERYAVIASKLSVTQSDVRAACAKIRKLCPNPASDFSEGTETVYVIPELRLEIEQGKINVNYIDEYVPTVSVSEYYRRMMKETEDTEIKKYLSEHIVRAILAVKAVTARVNTVLSCARAIAEKQRIFFLDSNGTLVPMTLSDVASTVGVHASTISRAIKDKYIESPRGVHSLAYFFSRSVGGVSAQNVKTRILRMLSDEGEDSVYSDLQIADNLAGEGICISRRTVAKYREEEGIPSSAVRRERMLRTRQKAVKNN